MHSAVQKSSICEKVFVIFVQWNEEKVLIFNFLEVCMCNLANTQVYIFALFSTFFEHFAIDEYFIFHQNCAKSIWLQNTLVLYHNEGRGDLALEKLVQDPSLKKFLYCMRPWKCFYMYIYYQTNNDHFQVKKLHLWNLKYGLFYGNLIPLPAVVIRLVGNNNHHFRWVIHDSANIILFLLKGCCAEV